MMEYRAIDIETIPTAEALSMEPPEKYLLKGVRDNFKPDTVEEYRERNRQAWREEVPKLASLDWRLGQIIACVVVTEDYQVEVRCGDPKEPEAMNEAELLTEFWDIFDGYRGGVTGFAIRDFDLPFLAFRSALCGVCPTIRWNESRYSPRFVVDWADILSGYGHFDRSGWTLAKYAEWFGLEHQPVGEGGDVLKWWVKGDEGSIIEHVRNDGLAAMELHKRFAGVLR